MPATPVYGLRYPAASDPADVPLDLQELALDVESKLRPAVVTSLPGSPVDGQEVHYVADATLGVVWHLRYRTAAPAPYRWEFVGGAPLLGEAAGGVSTTSGTYVDLGGGLPAVTAPLAGDYLIEIGVSMQASVSAMGLMAVKIGAAAAVDADSVLGSMSVNNQVAANMRSMRRTVPTAASVLKCQYRVAGETLFTNRWISAFPARVG